METVRFTAQVRAMMSRWKLFRIEQDIGYCFAIRIKDNILQWVSDRCTNNNLDKLVRFLDLEHEDMEMKIALEKMYPRLKLLILRDRGHAYDHAGNFLGSFDVRPDMWLVGSSELQELEKSSCPT